MQPDQLDQNNLNQNNTGPTGQPGPVYGSQPQPAASPVAVDASQVIESPQPIQSPVSPSAALNQAVVGDVSSQSFAPVSTQPISQDVPAQPQYPSGENLNPVSAPTQAQSAFVGQPIPDPSTAASPVASQQHGPLQQAQPTSGVDGGVNPAVGPLGLPVQGQMSPQATYGNTQQVPAGSGRLKSLNKKYLIVAAVAIVAIIGVSIIAFGSKGGFIGNAVSTVTGSGLKLEEYKHDGYGFSIKYPSGWIVKDSGEEYETSTEVTFREKAGDLSDKSEANIHTAYMEVQLRDSTDRVYSQEEAEDFFDRIKRNAQSSLEDENNTLTIEKEERVNIAGYPALRFKIKDSEYAYSGDNKTGYTYAVYVHVSKTKQYTIALEGHESEKDFHSAVDSIIKSFEVL